ncbi:MAG TPA: hypothetical protein P5164_13460, partial [Thermoanaerobaculia bacterium]|nr:hypothetical protein [Thermoanaerobaculia bacterium]
GTLLRDFDPEDLSTLGDFVQALGSGLPSTLCAAAQSVGGRPDPVCTLVRHMVAGATDVSYGDGMKARRGFYRKLSDLPSPLVAVRFLWTATLLTRSQIDTIYGPPRSRLGYLGRQLARPFDLVARYLRARRIRKSG